MEVNIQNGKISISRGDNENNNYIHTHISDGSICWGNIGPTINKLQGQLELHGLFQLVYQFLSTYNADDPYQRIERWNPDWEDEDYEDEPFCIFCDDYGHEVENCESCWWCEYCMEWVDHQEDECPSIKEEAVNEAA